MGSTSVNEENYVYNLLKECQFSSSSLVITRTFNSGDFEILVCIGLSI